MTYACSGLVACPKLQQDINGVFGMNPQLVTEDVRFLKFLLSGVNKTDTLQNQIDQKNGHRRMVELIYQPRELGGSSSTHVGNTCAGGVEPCNLSQIYEIDETTGSSKQWSIDLGELEEQCEDDESFVAKQVMRMIDLLTRDMDMRSVQQAAALVGNCRFGFQADATAPIPVATLASDACCNGRVTNAIEMIDYAFTELEWTGNIALFGGSFQYKSYWKAVELACCNQFGEDLAKFMMESQIVPFYDRYFADYLAGANNFIGMWPGALQLITFNAHRGAKGIRMIDDDSHKRGVIAHPNPEIPLLFDYYAELNCNKWNFYLGLAHQVVGAPTDMFLALDELNAVTGVLEFAITNP